MSQTALAENAIISSSDADTHARFGPQTRAGKQQSRRNATTHGVSNDGPVAAELLDESRVDEWVASLKPQGTQQLNLVRVVAHNASRIELCQARETELLRMEQVEAREAWNVKRTAEVTQLAKKLRRQPTLTAALLKQTLHGCTYLIERWNSLARAYLEQNFTWTGSQLRTAHDLLGIELDVRPAKWIFKAENVPPNEDVHLAVAVREIEVLGRLRDEHLAAVDDHVRGAAIRGFAAGTSRELRLNRRYEAEAHKRMATALETLKTLQTMVGADLEARLAETLATTVAEPVPTSLPDSPAVDAKPIETETCVAPEFVSGSSETQPEVVVETSATSTSEPEPPAVPSAPGENTRRVVSPYIARALKPVDEPKTEKKPTRHERRKQNEMRMALRKKGKKPAEG